MPDRYPRAFYNGDYTANEIRADYKEAQDAKQEAALRKKGYLDGHEFFSKPAVDANSFAGVFNRALQSEQEIKESVGKSDSKFSIRSNYIPKDAI